MLYEEYEAKTSYEILPKVLSIVPEPACLIGGWAVYHTVNADYKAKTGASYQGSKDIDLGFHMEENATAESLRETPFAKTSRALEEMGFRGMGGRLFKEYHRETCLPLSEAKAKRTPSYNLFQLYVDLLVDSAPEAIKSVVGFTPFDEKILSHVFKGRMFKMIDEFPVNVILPAPHVLLAMKMVSLPDRTKDHKKHKDVMDVYALIWHSGVPMQKLRADLSEVITHAEMSHALSEIGSSDYEQAANPLGIDPKKLKSVITNFVRGAPRARRSGSGWPLPKNMSYDKLVMTTKALLQKGADKAPATIDAVSGAVGIAAPTVKTGMSFLESIGIVSRHDGPRYTLTADGALYAKAHRDGDAAQIRSLTLDAIRRSHLADLEDAIVIDRGITRDGLYRRIKTFGNYPSGKGTGDMHAPVSTGVNTVLRLFEDAGLLQEGAFARAPGGPLANEGKEPRQASRRSGGAPSSAAPSAAGGGRRRGGGGGADGRTVHEGKGGPPPVDGDMDDLGVMTVKGVGQVRINDARTLGVAEVYMDMLRKMVSEGGA